MRHLILAAIILYLIGNPLHGHRENEPWILLEKGIAGFNVEQVSYMLHAFIPDRHVDMDLLAQMTGRKTGFIETGNGAAWTEAGWWSVCRSGEPGYMLIRVGGDDRDDSRLLWEEVQQAVNCNDSGCGYAWSIEVYANGEESGLAAIGLELLDRLGATMLSTNSYNGTVQILGHAPWYDETVNLAEGSVNLNIELFYEPYRQQVRIRAGVPVLISPISF